MYTAQLGLCACGCGERLNADGKGETGEHVWEFVALGNDNKPDALWRKQCARRKTNGPRGDLNTIAHVKRLRDGRTQYDKRAENGPKLKSTAKLHGFGFDTTLTKKMDGTVVKRDR